MGDQWTSGGNTWDDATSTNGNAFASGDVRNYTADGGDTGASEGCRNCGQDGHFARECTEPRKMVCFNCSEEGHTKAECPKPRVFTGACNICSVEGHPAAQCPNKPKNCTRCHEEGDHDTKDCKNNFYIDLDNVPDVSEGMAWSKIVNACLDNDIDDFKDAMRMLQKAAPEITYPAIEKKLRAQSLRYYLVATKKEVGDGYTLVNLQGEPEKTYCVGIFKSPDCHRPIMADKWPKSSEENLTRLADAGILLERGLPYCRTCSTFGHTTRNCEQEKSAVEGQPEIRCVLCDGIGHRVRDCTEPRQKPREPRACKICESTDHIAKDCDQKPAMTCRNCQGEGHKAADCTEPKVIKCANPDCGAIGHSMKACPIPIAYEKMICRHCGEKGHLSASRCAPGAAEKKQEENNRHNDNKNEAFDAGDTGKDEWATGNTETSATNGGDWDSGTNAQPIAASSVW